MSTKGTVPAKLLSKEPRRNAARFCFNRHLAPNLWCHLHSLFLPPLKAEASEATCSHVRLKKCGYEVREIILEARVLAAISKYYPIALSSLSSRGIQYDFCIIK